MKDKRKILKDLWDKGWKTKFMDGDVSMAEKDIDDALSELSKLELGEEEIKEVEEAVKLQTKEWKTHYEGRTTKTATKDYLDIGRTLKVLIDTAQAILQK